MLRILLLRDATNVVATGWVLEAENAVAVPLGSWTEGGATSKSATPAGRKIEKTDLTGTSGGAVSWSAVYDAVLNRFAFHDPLSDLASVAPGGVDDNCAAYLVAGWWSDAANDPLDSTRNNDSLHELLERLRWRLLYEWGDEQWASQQQEAQFALRKALGLTTEGRWSDKRPADIPMRRGHGRHEPVCPDRNDFSATTGSPGRIRIYNGCFGVLLAKPGTCARLFCTARSMVFRFPVLQWWIVARMHLHCPLAWAAR